MDKSLSDILRDQSSQLTEAELLQFARYLIKSNMTTLTVNQLSRVYRLVRDLAAENGAA